MPSPDQDLFLHADDAWRLVNEEKDLAVQQLVAGLLTAVMLEPHKAQRLPSSPVDLPYLARAARAFFSRRELIDAILRGEDGRWFPEDWEERPATDAPS